MCLRQKRQMNGTILYRLMFPMNKRNPDLDGNVIKLSSFKQKVTLPELHKREKEGLFLSKLCYQKDYKGDTSNARYNNDEFIQYTSECFWYSMRFEDSHIEWENFTNH